MLDGLEDASVRGSGLGGGSFTAIDCMESAKSSIMLGGSINLCMHALCLCMMLDGSDNGVGNVLMDAGETATIVPVSSPSVIEGLTLGASIDRS